MVYEKVVVLVKIHYEPSSEKVKIQQQDIVTYAVDLKNKHLPNSQ